MFVLGVRSKLMENKKGQAMVGLMVVLFLGVIVVLALLPQIATNVSVVKEKQVATDEVVSVATAKLTGSNDFNGSIDLGPVAFNPTTVGAWQAANCPLTSIAVTNASGTALTVTTDYTLDTTTGNLRIVNNSDTVAAFATSNNSLIDYTYCAEGYGTSAGSRSMASIIIVFAALGLLGFVIWGAIAKTGLLKS